MGELLTVLDNMEAKINRDLANQRTVPPKLQEFMVMMKDAANQEMDRHMQAPSDTPYINPTQWNVPAPSNVIASKKRKNPSDNHDVQRRTPPEARQATKRKPLPSRDL